MSIAALAGIHVCLTILFAVLVMLGVTSAEDISLQMVKAEV